ESLLDSFGARDREESRKLGVPSFRLFYHFLEALMRAGNSAIIEANFKPDYDSEKLLYLVNKYAFMSFQVHCATRDDILLERYRVRGQSGSRHPGHFDQIAYSDLEKDLLKGYYKPLEIGGEIIHIDTTDFNKIDYDSLYNRIPAYLPPIARL
ncbi:MAG: hypothetical protein V3R96_08330, partial [Dehalococcoidales bacterium]